MNLDKQTVLDRLLTEGQEMLSGGAEMLMKYKVLKHALETGQESAELTQTWHEVTEYVKFCMEMEEKNPQTNAEIHSVVVNYPIADRSDKS